MDVRNLEEVLLTLGGTHSMSRHSSGRREKKVFEEQSLGRCGNVQLVSQYVLTPPCHPPVQPRYEPRVPSPTCAQRASGIQLVGPRAQMARLSTAWALVCCS